MVWTPRTYIAPYSPLCLIKLVRLVDSADKSTLTPPECKLIERIRNVFRASVRKLLSGSF